MRTCRSRRDREVRRSGIGRMELFAAMLSLIFIVFLILSWFFHDRELARHTQCAGRLRAIGIAMDNYYNTFRVFPLGVGMKGESCLLPILPFLESPHSVSDGNPLAAYGHVNKIPSSDLFFQIARPQFHCPCESVADETRMSTSYHGCAGDRIEVVSQADIENETWTARNVSGQSCDPARPRRYTYESISDGLNNTIAFAESRIATGQAATHWDENTSLFTDWQATVTKAIPRKCMANRGIFDVSTRTANHRWLGAKWYDGRMTCTRFLTILPPNAPSCVQGEEMHLPLVSVSSYHAGGVNVLLFDGSVRFVSDKVDSGDLGENAIFTYWKGSGDAMAPSGTLSPFGVWGAMGTMCGDEIVGLPDNLIESEQEPSDKPESQDVDVENAGNPLPPCPSQSPSGGNTFVRRGITDGNSTVRDTVVTKCDSRELRSLCGNIYLP